MQERLLHYIWQFRYFNQQQLTTTDGTALTIIFPGKPNVNQGPDFLEAKIKLHQTVWVGNIELHVQASDWYKHAHENDVLYQPIILHVVWQADKQITIAEHTIPTVELQPLVSFFLLERYKSLMESQQAIPCINQLPVLAEIVWMNWKERLVLERLQRKTTDVMGLYALSAHHWEEVLWWMMAKYFGASVNADAFVGIAQSIPTKLLAKHKQQLIQIEAILQGQAGLIPATSTDAYVLLLQREYNFLQKKYQLKKPAEKPLFLRMRPANFPSIRLAQLAVLIHQSTHLFSTILAMENVQELVQKLTITANDYWHYHYRFDDEPHNFLPKQTGNQLIQQVIINAIIPVLFAYGLFKNEAAIKQKAFNWLVELKPEQNNIIRQWKLAGIKSSSAMESQALLELYQHYCITKKCLQCAVANQLLKSQR